MVKKIVYETISLCLNIPQDKISEEDRLTEVVQDSIQLFSLLLSFEKKFGRLRYEDVADIETVGDIVKYAQSTYGANFVPENF